MRRRRVPALLLARLPRAGDDRGSIPMLMLAILIGVTLGGLILSMVIGQSRTTRFDTTRVHSLHAAQTGIDVALGEIRTAKGGTEADGSATGDDAGLPCGPFAGSANGTSEAGYSASITYYLTDPSVPGATKMTTCVPGFGPYFQTGNTRTPRYALITSEGTDGAAVNGGSAGRTLTTTYVFQTDDTDIAGGVIRIFPDASGNLWCMDAGSATPAPGTAVLLRACSTSNPPAAQQTFAYRSDLSIQLVSSITSDQPTGLCLDTNPTSHSAGYPMVLAPCTVSNKALKDSADDGVAPCSTASAPCSASHQQWSVDDSAHLHGAKIDRSGLDSYCINVASQSDGQALTIQTCAGSVTDTKQTWVPSPTAGAGMANNATSTGTRQQVNFQQFATCIDVTNQDPSSSFLILYTCKQSPDGAVAWNQEFTPSPALDTKPTKVLLTTVDGSTRYCLTSPRAPGGYVTVKSSCQSSVSSADPQYVWTVNTTKDEDGNDLSYADKYTITDADGRCLGPGPNSDMFNGQYLKVVVTTCDGSTGQKWNADPSLNVARLTNTKEK